VRTAKGWTAEVWIPAQTLTFVGGNALWGLQFDRSIVRDQTELRWASPTLDANLWDMRRAGEMELDAPLKQAHGIEFAPYSRGTMVRNNVPENRNWMGAAGGEITWRITPQLAAIATVDTDFAETEVDSRQINITPWPLYFPEKRTFFLEGANQYDFGLGLSSTFPSSLVTSACSMDSTSQSTADSSSTAMSAHGAWRCSTRKPVPAGSRTQS
jgi:hypothetical protein